MRQHVLPNGRKVMVGGRLRPPHMYGLAKFGDAVNVAALPVPPEWSWNAANPANNYQGLGNILGNNEYGDCTCAGMAHILDRERGASGNAYAPIQTGATLWAYSQVTNPAFNIATGQNDNGADEITVLNWWQSHGFFQDGTGKIVGWATLDATNWEEVKAAAWLFDVYLGVSLPAEWTQDVTAWNVAGPPQPNEGHCVVGVGYNSKSLLVDSWGYVIPVSWAAVKAYFTPPNGGAAYVVFTEDSINKASGKAPNGFNVAQLMSYLAAFK